MSLTSAFSVPVNQRAPTSDAAGPLKMVSMGRSRACSADISAPSPRTTIMGADIPRDSKVCVARPINRSIIPISRAFRSAVIARFGPFSFADS